MPLVPPPPSTTSGRPIPVHPGLPLLGNTLAFARDPLATLTDVQRRYERIVQLAIGGRTQYLLLTPEDTKHVLQENNRNYGRGPGFIVLRRFLGNGLLTSDGDFWRRQRRLAQPAFHRQKLIILAETMIREATAWVDSLRSDAPIDLSQAFMDVTMRIVCKTLFGTDVAGRLNGLSAALSGMNEYANQLLINPVKLPNWLPTPGNVRFRRASAQVDAFIYDIIRQRRASPGVQHDDLLDMLLHAVDEETGERMSDQQLRDECVTLFTAGHETTAVSMAWTTYLLAQPTDVVADTSDRGIPLARLRSEIGHVVAGGALTPEHLRALPYTSQVIQESMRLYPPAWIMSRLAYADDRFGDYVVKRGSTVLVSPYLLHRHPAYWPEPDRFDPDRFAPGVATPGVATPGSDKERPAYTYLPFSGGPRLCIGNQFALMEMQILLALLVQRFDVRLLTRTLRTQPLITLRPRQPLRVQLTRI